MDIWWDGLFWFKFFKRSFDVDDNFYDGLALERIFEGHGGEIKMVATLGPISRQRQAARGINNVVFSVDGMFTLTVKMDYVKNFDDEHSYVEYLTNGLVYWIKLHGNISMPFFAERKFKSSKLKLAKGVKKEEVETFLAMMILSIV